MICLGVKGPLIEKILRISKGMWHGNLCVCSSERNLYIVSSNHFWGENWDEWTGVNIWGRVGSAYGVGRGVLGVMVY